MAKQQQEQPQNNKYIQNTFTGLNMDSHPDSGANNYYNYALNLVHQDLEQTGFISNEYANKKCVDLGSTIVGASYIEARNETLYFLKNGELWLVNHDNCNKTFVASDTEFGCDWGFKDCEWVYGEFKNLIPCNETHVYWSSDCQYYSINLAEMLDPKRKAALKKLIKKERKQCSDKTCDYFRLFKCVCSPRIAPIPFQAGGQLAAGAYQFVTKLRDRDGSDTNWFNISDPVYISSEHNVGGERSTGYIEINLSDLDCKYDQAEIAVIKTIAGVTTASILTNLYYSSGKTTYTYYGNDDGSPIDLFEVLSKRNTYIQGQDLLQKDGTLFLYNLKQIANIDYQRRANKIKNKVKLYRYSYEEVKRLNLKSFMRGETYAFGIKWNYCDGTSTPVFHIPAQGGAGSGNASSNPSTTSSSSNGNYTYTHKGQYKRQREAIKDTVEQPQGEKYDAVIKETLDNWQTEMDDACQALTQCSMCAKPGQQCNVEKARVEKLAGQGMELLSNYQLDDLDSIDHSNITLSVSKIKEGARKISDAVDKRERLVKERENITVSGKATDYTGSKVANGEEDEDTVKFFGSNYYDVDGVITSEIPQIYNLGETTVKKEQDIVYPDMKNCMGEDIYGDLTGTPVKHHQFPWTHQSVHYESNSTGVPSIVTPDADEYSDGYVHILGIEFYDIEFLKDDEVCKPLCKENPFTICYVKRTSSNKTIIAKGLATKNYISSNAGKEYVYPRHAVNSFETVDRHIDIGDTHLRMQVGAENDKSFMFHSLDTNTKKLALNFKQIIPELEYFGVGYRHGLYAEGRPPDDSFYGTKVDQRGARSAINLNKNTSTDNTAIDSIFQIYAQPNGVVSPPRNNVSATQYTKRPLVTKFRESAVWIGGVLPPLTKGKTANSDGSFVGDVYDHAAPIDNAAGQYVTLYRDLPNQYGDLTGLVYHPILQATANSKQTGLGITVGRIQGICGDIYIGPYSFRRTSYISDKVGDKFDIPQGQAHLGLPVTKKEKRSICDSPEDPIYTNAGMWIHTKLPTERDAADAKNYAGLHSPSSNFTEPWLEAKTKTEPESDFYYPKVAKFLITYWGEFDVCPWLREKGNPELGEVAYPNIQQLELDSNAPSAHPWEECYLNRFYVKNEQPSKWTAVKKTLIRTLLTVILPGLGLGWLLDPSTGVQFVGNLAATPMLIALWYLLSQQLFTNDYLDKLLGIPECHTDTDGGEGEDIVVQLEDNYSRYNSDYSKVNDISVFYGMTDPYNTCKCCDCLDFTTNDIVYSNKQIITSPIDAYKNFRANSYVSVTSDMGRLKKMFILGNSLFAHTTDSLLMLTYGQTTIPSSAGEILIGAGGLLQEPKPLIEGVPEGYMGLTHPNHSISTQYGYFFLDYDAKKIYKFYPGSAPEEISQNGIFHFTKEYLQFCNPTSCINENVNGTSYFSMGVDPRNNRFLFTKSDGEASWTLSYDIIGKKWISFHSYIPQFYIWDRDHMYTIKKNAVWIHNEKCKFQTFYDEYFPFIIEFPSRSPETEIEAFEYKSSILNTQTSTCVSGNRLDQHTSDITFNKLWVRNSYQTTGYLNLNPVTVNQRENLSSRLQETGQDIAVVRQGQQWRVNNFYDYTEYIDKPLTEYKDCSIVPEPINVNYSETTDQSFSKRIIYDNYLITRLIFDKVSTHKIYFKNYLTYIKKTSN